MVTPPLGQPALDDPFDEEIFPTIQFKPLLVQPKDVSSNPITSYMAEEIDIHM